MRDFDEGQGIIMDNLHKRALEWFSKRQGSLIPPPRKLEDTDLFLAQSAKAIHVPKGWSHALSIKSLPEGPYDDGDVEFDGDGHWSLRYHQEEQDGVPPENLHSHKALMQCMKDGIPVAVLVRHQRKPQKTLYSVIGLARELTINPLTLLWKDL